MCVITSEGTCHVNLWESLFDVTCVTVEAIVKQTCHRTVSGASLNRLLQIHIAPVRWDHSGSKFQSWGKPQVLAFVSIGAQKWVPLF